jgi:periplasmic divalent cation tolerance protein
MAKKSAVLVVLVTCGSAREAERIARALVEKRLAACGNVVGSPITSIYRWKGKVERAKEVLLILKTARAKFSALEKEIRRLHSYETPEIIAMEIEGGSEAYLDWVLESTRA